MKNPAVYMLASQRNGTLYIGVTSDLVKRVWQHKEGLADGFTKQHGVKILVWYEQHETMESAISKEKAMKKWLRQWKLNAIEKFNADWVDLWPAINGETAHPVTPSGIPPTHSVIPLSLPVIPAKAGIHPPAADLDSRLRANDDGTKSQPTTTTCSFVPATSSVVAATISAIPVTTAAAPQTICAASETIPLIPATTPVIPAKAGIQPPPAELDSRLRGNDDGSGTQRSVSEGIQ